MTLFNFTADSDISNWKILDDVVMGGRSDGNFKMNTEGHGEYTGRVSLKNNGGFSNCNVTIGFYIAFYGTNQFKYISLYS